jgi:alanine dehydrogenase
MLVGVPKERKDGENRVGMTPSGVRTLVSLGHKVWVEEGAGLGSGISDQEYRAAGADLSKDPIELFKKCEMIVKVKEPVQEEYDLLQKDQILFAYLHLAAMPQLVEALVHKGCNAFAYEMVEENGQLPLLYPMSEVAGRMSVQIASRLMEKSDYGKGIFLGGVPGVAPAEVTIIGGGVVGYNAARIATGLGAQVTIIDNNPFKLRQLDDLFKGRVRTLISNSDNISESVIRSDVVIGAVLLPGKRAPKLVTREMVSSMRKGSVIIDVAIDQGGCIETADRVSTHSNPVYEVDGVVHYAVPNIPAIVPRTSTYSLTNATLPHIVKLAESGWERAVTNNAALAKAANVVQGKVLVNF